MISHKHACRPHGRAGMHGNLFRGLLIFISIQWRGHWEWPRQQKWAELQIPISYSRRAGSVRCSFPLRAMITFIIHTCMAEALLHYNGYGWVFKHAGVQVRCFVLKRCLAVFTGRAGNDHRASRVQNNGSRGTVSGLQVL